MGGKPLDAPIVGMAATPTGRGTTWWRPTAACSRSVTPSSTVRWEASRCSGPWWGRRRPVPATGWWPPTADLLLRRPVLRVPGMTAPAPSTCPDPPVVPAPRSVRPVEERHDHTPPRPVRRRPARRPVRRRAVDMVAVRPVDAVDHHADRSSGPRVTATRSRRPGSPPVRPSADCCSGPRRPGSPCWSGRPTSPSPRARTVALAAAAVARGLGQRASPGSALPRAHAPGQRAVARRVPSLGLRLGLRRPDRLRTGHLHHHGRRLPHDGAGRV